MKFERIAKTSFSCWIVNSLVLASLWLAFGAVAWGQDESLDALIDGAQKKMVKIFGATAGRVEGYGTGILVSNNGLIVTAQGVYLDGPQVRVLLADGSEHVATILRRDRMVQLALLKIDCETPNYFDLSNESGSQKGDWILAISNAFKVADQDEPLSVTMGNIGLQSSIAATLCCSMQSRATPVARGGRLLISRAN